MNNRPLRDFERGAHLHVLDWTHQTARHRFGAAGQVQVKAAAKAIAKQPINSAHLMGPPHLPALEAALHGELRKLYAVGHATVRSELDHQRSGDPLPIGLSKAEESVVTLALADAHPDSLLDRARLAASDVAHQIWQAVHRGRLHGLTDRRVLRQLGQAAGHGALRAAASHHAGGAIQAGRHAAATAQHAQILGGRYTSVLDKSTCVECEHADTGELIPLGSPAWIPAPNPACLGGDRCRCIIVYQLAPETPGDRTLLPPDDFPSEPRQPDRPSGVGAMRVAQVGVGAS